MVGPQPRRRWPAYALAVLFLGYAGGKAVFAAQSRLGFPGGPPVSAAESEAYFLDPALAQWFATASGLVGAGIALATVTAWGLRAVPRWLMLVALAVMAAAVVGGAGIMALGGFIGLGVGWRWYHGVVGLVVGALCVETVRSYVAVTKRVAV
ncbi:hypothetical protein GCM10010492_67190 [Saccharothrix mutabilis subsp. mutabilis]|uniref:Uncharacterized protein n=1 Tax=Saccharothrix mutabilis subsp. mutabilis TaxID=66855 RepID=A0ABN0UP89_9PSEU